MHYININLKIVYEYHKMFTNFMFILYNEKHERMMKLKLLDQMKDENLGCALLYNFTKGYQKPVPIKIYDYVLPLLFDSEFSKNIVKSGSFDQCVKLTLKEKPALFNEIHENFEDLQALTSRTLGVAVIQQLIAFQVGKDGVSGEAKESSILEFNEAIQLGKWFSELNEKQIGAYFKIRSKKIVILDADSLGQDMDLSSFKQLGDLTIYNETKPEEVVERIQDASYVIVNKVILDEFVLSQVEHIEYIGITATGMNNVDLDYCKNHGIKVTNVSNYSTPIVAQHTFALLLQLMNHVAYYDHYVKSKKYAKSSSFTHMGPVIEELAGKTWGIVGLGAIGKEVAKIATSFGCQVIYYSSTGKNNNATYKQVTFDELLQESDIISIHAPLTKQTHYLFNNKAFAHMKRSAYLINVGRGPIVQEEELAFALKHHLIAGAGLDVFEQEPMDLNNPLLELDGSNLVLTPHVAWASKEARLRLVKLVFEQLQAYIEENEE